MLAFADELGWNAQSFTPNGPMTRKKFLLPDFDACSVALFASLVFMGPQPGRAQAPLSPRPGLSAPRDEPSEPSTTVAALVQRSADRKRSGR